MSTTNSINLSFEIYPTNPIDWLATHDLLTTLVTADPKFVSIAYSNHELSFFDTSLALARFTQAYHLPIMLHLPASCFTMQAIDKIMADCLELEINDFLIISGDANNQNSDFKNSLALFTYLKNKYPMVNLYGACHPQTSKLANTAHITALQPKISAGAQGFISQVFFENSTGIDLAQQMKATQLELTAGLMPITTPAQIDIVTNKLNLTIPPELQNNLLIHQNDYPYCQQLGYNFTSRQIKALAAAGVNNFHIFTMNQAACVTYLNQNVTSSV